MTTQILNKRECGYQYFNTLGKKIYGCGWQKGVDKLHITRVIIVGNNTKKHYGILSRFGLCTPEVDYDVDADIVLADGTIIEIHTTDPNFVEKLLPYVWELQKDVRDVFYRRK